MTIVASLERGGKGLSDGAKIVKKGALRGQDMIIQNMSRITNNFVTHITYEARPDGPYVRTVPYNGVRTAEKNTRMALRIYRRWNGEGVMAATLGKYLHCFSVVFNCLTNFIITR